MRWLEIFLALVAVSCFGISWGALFVFALCISASYWFIHVFLRKRWDMDWYFETAFKIFERFGCGTPHRLDRMSFTSYTAVDGYSGLDEIPKALEDSIRRLIDNIVRDFILVWYSDVARGQSFIDESRRVLEMLSVELYRRACQVDTYRLIKQTVLTYHAHHDRFVKALAVVEAKDPKLGLNISPVQLLFQTYESQLPSKHAALIAPAQELSYLRNVVDSLLVALIPKDSFSCNAGFFIFREIVAVQVLQPLVSKLLTDPDWLNEVLIDLLTSNKITLDTVNKSVVDSVDSNEQVDGNNFAAEGEHSKVETNANDRSLNRDDQCSTEESCTELSRETAVTSVDTEDKKLGTETVENENAKDSCQGSTAPLSKVNLYQHSPDVGKCGGHSESFLVISMENNVQTNGCKVKEQQRKAWSTEVIPSSSLDEQLALSRLSSSWDVCPSPKNSTESEDFGEMKDKLPQEDNNSRSGKSLGDFCQDIKTMSCCGNFQESEDLCRDPRGAKVTEFSEEGGFPKLRSKSFSLPQICVENSKMLDPNSCLNTLRRSISVPCFLESESKLSETDALFENHERSAALSLLKCGPFYSFYSSSESLKSVSTDDESVDEEEAMEVCEDDRNTHVRDTFSMLFQASAGSHHGSTHSRKRWSITKQAGFEECYGWQFQLPAPEVLGVPVHGPSGAPSNQHSSSEGSGYKNLHYEHGSERAKMSEALKDIEEHSGEVGIPKNMDKECGCDKGNSDSFLAESILSAGRKFVSNFKPPFSSSSGSTKSSETSVTSETGLQGVALSLNDDNGGASRSEVVYTLGIQDGESLRTFSSGDGPVLQSFGRAVEPYYRSLEDANPTRGDIVYECSGMNEGAVKIHPSTLIIIPNTETANESVWEPGRSKYTMYIIEYDIRIWPDVYEAAIQESKGEDPKSDDTDDSKSTQAQDQDVSKFWAVSAHRKIKRRYREFMELHHRLSTGIHKEDMKDILKPNRKYSLHFTRLEPGVVEGRRSLLEYYVVSLVSKPTLRNSDELKQFLGVAGGEHVPFVRSSVVQVPRVDKMLSRQVTKVFDSIKTAFDSVEEGQLAQILTQSKSTLGVDDDIPWKIGIFLLEQLEKDMPCLLSEECCDVFIAEQEDRSSQTPFPPEDTDRASDSVDDVNGLVKKLKATKLKKLKATNLGPRTAGDGCEAPTSPSFASDDMLYGNTTQGEISSGIVHSGRPKRFHKPLTSCLSQSPSKIEFLENNSDIQDNPFCAQKILVGKPIQSGCISKSVSSLDNIDKEPRQKAQIHLISAQTDPPLSPSALTPSQVQVKTAKDGVDHGAATSDKAGPPSAAQYPLASAILSLTCEVLNGQGSWTSIDRVQEMFIGVFGGLFEWRLLREVDDVVSDEGCAFALDKLNEAIWPNGKLREETSVRSEKEKAETKKKAVQALIDVFPEIFRVLVGPSVYDESAINLVNSLHHPQINRILLFQLLELLLSELLPELSDNHVQQN